MSKQYLDLHKRFDELCGCYDHVSQRLIDTEAKLEEQTKLQYWYRKLMLQSDSQKMAFVHELEDLKQRISEVVNELRTYCTEQDCKWADISSDWIDEILRKHGLIEEDKP